MAPADPDTIALWCYFGGEGAESGGSPVHYHDVGHRGLGGLGIEHQPFAVGREKRRRLACLGCIGQIEGGATASGYRVKIVEFVTALVLLVDHPLAVGRVGWIELRLIGL